MKACGTTSAYAKGCRCDDCRAAMRRYMKHRRMYGSNLIDSTGSRRRLQALAAIGWPQYLIGERVGRKPGNLYNLIHKSSSARIQRSTAERIAALYDEWSMTPGPSSHARTVARRNGWVPPLAWDDDTIDNPAAEPQGHLRPMRLSAEDDVAELLAMGETYEAIAQRLGLAVGTVQFHAYRLQAV